MYEMLVSFAKWLEGTPWGTGVRTSLWAYPFTQLIHFTGLSIWLGTNLALDLRLLGLGKRRETAAQLRDDLFAWNWIGFLHRRAGRFSSIFLDRDDVSGQHCLPLETRHFCSAGFALAHLRAMEGARLGSDAERSCRRKIIGAGGNFALGVRDYRGCRDSQPLIIFSQPIEKILLVPTTLFYWGCFSASLAFWEPSAEI